MFLCVFLKVLYTIQKAFAIGNIDGFIKCTLTSDGALFLFLSGNSLGKEVFMNSQRSRCRISYEEHIIIEDMLDRKQTLYAISKKLNRLVSTISREVKK